MRSPDQIKKIKSTISSPYSIEDFISQSEIDYLIKLYRTNSQTEKKTGVNVLGIENLLDDSVISGILKKIEKEIGLFEVTAGLFFYATYPHIIHNDDTYQLPENVYKAISITLEIEGQFTDFPRLCLFDQFYFHGPAKFFNGDTGGLTEYNTNVYEYSNVNNVVDTALVEGAEYLTHLKPMWYKGLSLQSTFKQRPGTAVIFDSTQLHCSSDFRKLGITGKLGLSIFTKKNDKQ